MCEHLVSKKRWPKYYPGKETPDGSFFFPFPVTLIWMQDG
jgi:hypothetical protein